MGPRAALALLGLQAWGTIVAAPAWAGMGGAPSTARALACAAPLALLALGAARRSAGWLLGGFPAALLAPLSAWPDLADPARLGAAGGAAVVVSLLAWLLGTAWVLERLDEGAVGAALVRATAAPPAARRGASPVLLHGAAVAATAALPLATALWISAAGDELRRTFPGRARGAAAAAVILAAGFWLVALRALVVGPLSDHARGERGGRRAASSRPVALLAWGAAALVALGALAARCGR